MLVHFFLLAGIGLNIVKAKYLLPPKETIIPKLSGIRTIKVENYDFYTDIFTSTYYIFSGSIDSINFSSNIIGLDPKIIQ